MWDFSTRTASQSAVRFFALPCSVSLFNSAGELPSIRSARASPSLALYPQK
jgi:hypothetical protein